jgi:hypothetical protein
VETPKRPFVRVLGRYGPELIVVFVGVWLSLLAEDWRQQRVDSATELASLRRIATDLAADLEDLRLNLRRAEAGVSGGLSLIGEIGAEGHGSLERDLSSLQFSAFFVENPGEYQALRNSGQLGVIREEALRSRIVTHYESRAFLRRLHENDYQWTERVQDLMLPYVRLLPLGEAQNPGVESPDGFPDTSRPRVSEVLDTLFVTYDAEFQNAVVTLVARRRFLIREIERTISSAEALRSELSVR